MKHCIKCGVSGTRFKESMCSRCFVLYVVIEVIDKLRCALCVVNKRFIRRYSGEEIKKIEIKLLRRSCKKCGNEVKKGLQICDGCRVKPKKLCVICGSICERNRKTCLNCSKLPIEKVCYRCGLAASNEMPFNVGKTGRISQLHVKCKKLSYVKKEFKEKRGRKRVSVMDLPDRKVCTKCGEMKHISDYPFSKGYYRSTCKKCHNEVCNAWKYANREQYLAYLKKYHKTYQRKK